MPGIARLGPPDPAIIYKLGQVRHSLQNLSMNQNANVSLEAQLETASQITYNLSMTAARGSVLMLYRRIFTLTNTFFRTSWWICMAAVVGYSIALFVTLGLQCSPYPMKMLWQHPEKCHTSTRDPMILGFVNAALDFCVLLLPLRMMWNLKMSKRQKGLVGGLLSLGLL